MSQCPNGVGVRQAVLIFHKEKIELIRFPSACSNTGTKLTKATPISCRYNDVSASILADACKGHELMESSDHIGKIILVNE
jgi:hypothetical protein